MHSLAALPSVQDGKQSGKAIVAALPVAPPAPRAAAELPKVTQPSPEPFQSLFGTSSIAISNVAVGQRWKGVLAEAADVAVLAQCNSASDEICALPRLAAMRQEIARLREATTELKVRAVNEFVNRHFRYAADMAVYGQADHWATLREFVSQGRGDCEDFAIAKMWMLKALGVPRDAIRLVVLRDHASRQDHAVLAVQHEAGVWVLDNRFGVVRADADLPHYRPYYSLSAAGFSWVHSVPVAANPAVAQSTVGPQQANLPRSKSVSEYR